MALDGVIKFTLAHTLRGTEQKPIMTELDNWRTILRQHRLIGSDLNRIGYGNISARLPNNEFIITGSQTGHIPTLSKEHYAIVTGYDLDCNIINSYGTTKPSSEALTHAALYSADKAITAIFHVHSSTIWNAGNALNIITTPIDVQYGTPEMARAIAFAHKSTSNRKTYAIIMAGHQDGIITYGKDTQEAGITLLDLLNRATEWQKRNTQQNNHY